LEEEIKSFKRNSDILCKGLRRRSYVYSNTSSNDDMCPEVVIGVSFVIGLLAYAILKRLPGLLDP